MKKKITYVCELCGTPYETEQSALECEQDHFRSKCIVRELYERRGKYPMEIGVAFANGVIRQYKPK